MVNDPYASPRHCRLTEGAFCVWTVQDLGSTNGMWIDRLGSFGGHLTAGESRVMISGAVLVAGRTRMPPFTPERVTG